MPSCPAFASPRPALLDRRARPCLAEAAARTTRRPRRARAGPWRAAASRPGGGDGEAAGPSPRPQEPVAARPPAGRDAGLPIQTRLEMLEVYYGADESKFQRNLGSAFSLGSRNFAVEWGEMVLSVRRLFGFALPAKFLPPECLGLTLCSEAVNEREVRREEEARRCRLADPSRLPASDLAVDELSPVTRLLYSTLGWWRSPELMNIHYSEQLNEAFHCSVCESLGGDKKWSDRFTAFHCAVAYYWFLVILFFVSPAESYAFSHALEMHAVDTYGQFLDENESVLKQLPPPKIAYLYYDEFLYYFQEFQMDQNVRRPKLDSLYDVFQNILEDEREHAKTVAACVDYTKLGKKIKFKGRDLNSFGRDSREKLSHEERRQYWKKWTSSQSQSGGLHDK